MQSFEAFSRKHRIGTLPESFRTEKPSVDDVIDVLKPSLFGLPSLAGLYYFGGVPAFAVGLAGAVAAALWGVKRDYSGWAFEPYPEVPVISEEEIKDLIEEHGRWWGQDLQDALDANNIQARVVSKDDRSASLIAYELDVSKGFNIEKLSDLGSNFSRDLGLPMGMRVTVEANIGNGRAGLFLPKSKRDLITLSSLINSQDLKNLRIPIVVGNDLMGNLLAFDLVEAKHTLVGGETGSGKSVQIANMILSIAHNLSPDDVEITLIDPKMVELAMFSGLPHIEGDHKEPITDMGEAVHRLKHTCATMMERYSIMQQAASRDIEGYNRKSKKENRLKYKIIVIDELASFIGRSDEVDNEGEKIAIGKLAESYITEIARVGRAAGILLIIGTQRFDAKTFGGQLRDNIPSVIGFTVNARSSSQILIGRSGCENLFSKGDCYLLLTGSQYPVRCQSAFIKDEEIETMVKAIDAKWSEPSI